MKVFLQILAVLLSAALTSQAQNPQKTATLPPPLKVREVSGIVKDGTDNGVAYATVKLLSVMDTITAGTNEDGIFVFKNVKSASYTLEIKSIGKGWIKYFKWSCSKWHAVYYL